MALGFMAISGARSTVFIIDLDRPIFRQTQSDLNIICDDSRASTILKAKQRASVEEAIRETCDVQKWILRAINIRTNHVHTVVSIGTAKPERALNAFKAYATRKMRKNGCWSSEHSPWADKGSKRNLWNERSVALAIDYVLYGQGDDLPHFD